MNREQFKAIFKGASPDFWRINPHLGAVDNPERKPHKRSEGEDRALETCPVVVGWRVVIISLRKKLVDGHDNLRTGAKPLVDAIADTLGRDDAEIEWEYQQFKTDGETGTIVRIEPQCPG